MRHLPVLRTALSVSAVALLQFATPLAAAPAYVVENYAIPKPLTDTPGDPARGLAAMADRELGNCFGCHVVPVDAEFFGTTGPTLVGVGLRLNAAQLRLRLVDSKHINPMTMMPAYFRSEGLHRVAEKFQGKTVLSAQQIEDVVAYLMTLKSAP